MILFEFLLMAATFAAGFVLSRMGVPYNQILFNLHKFLVLGNIVYLNYKTVPIVKGGNPGGGLLLFLVIADILFLLAMISGGIQNLENLPYRQVVKICHKIAPWLTAVAVAALIYRIRLIQ